MGTGDNVYYDGPFIGRAETHQQIRRKYHEQFSQPRFVDLFQQVATYWMKDDHDFRFNDSDPINPYLVERNYNLDYYPKTNIYEHVSGSGSLPSAKLGIRMFQEQVYFFVTCSRTNQLFHEKVDTFVKQSTVS